MRLALLGLVRAVWIAALLMGIALANAHLCHAQRQSFLQYGSADGLSNLNVRCLLQDPTGYIWVGTDNGLFRYDGGTFKSYGHADGLPDTEIVSLAESPDGVLWVGTGGGAALLDGSRFVPVDPGNRRYIEKIVFDARGRMYVETSSEFVRVRPDGAGSYRFDPILAGEVRGLAATGMGVLFARNKDLWRLRGDNKVESIGASKGLPLDRWSAIAEDTDGNLWVRSIGRLYELARGQAMFKDRSAGVPADNSNSELYADGHGRLYVSTLAGAVVLEGEGRTLLDVRHGLPANPSGPVLVDREESLWMGTDGGALVRRLGRGEWLSWKKEDGLVHNTVWSILSDQSGRMWIGTSGGLNIFRPGSEPGTELGTDSGLADAGSRHVQSPAPSRVRSGMQTWTVHNGLAANRVLALVRSPAGDIFAGTDPASIARFNRWGRLRRVYQSSSLHGADSVSAMAIDHQGRLWAMGRRGCLRSSTPVDSTADLRFEPVEIPGIPQQSIFRSVAVGQDGTVWIASTKGLARFDGADWKVFGPADGLKSIDVAAVAAHGSDLWIGYRDTLGITRFRFNGSHFALTHYSEADGVPSDAIYAIAFDSGGRVWINTDRGVGVFEHGRWRHYGSQDGLIWDDTDGMALYVDPAGSVWVGTSGGLSRFSPFSYRIPEAAPTVVITGAEGTSQSWEAAQHPVLPYTQRALTIRYAALTYQEPDAVRFRYRLGGNDKRWTETRARSLDLAALPAGEYAFEVIAAGSNGLWSPVPARFAFSIRPPWWQTPWFLAGALAILLLLGHAVWQLRVRVLMAQKHVLEQQVAERTAALILSHRQLEELAYRDTLTTLPNRRMFGEEFRTRIETANQHSKAFALVLIDLDFFKQINDTFGHDAGDAVLVETAARLRTTLREDDCVARLGGDEFAILISKAQENEAVEIVCQRIVDQFAPAFVLQEEELRLGCSAGVALYPVDGATQEALYKAADLALYTAKRRGRNSFCLHRSAVEEQVALAGGDETI